MITRKGREPHEKEGTNFLSKEGKPNLNSLPPPPRAPINAIITYLRKAGGPLPLRNSLGKGLRPQKRQGLPKGLEITYPPPQFLPPRE